MVSFSWTEVSKLPSVLLTMLTSRNVVVFLKYSYVNLKHGVLVGLPICILFVGTDEERGIIIWREVPEPIDEDSDEDIEGHDNSNLSLKTYDLPFGNNFIRNSKWGKYVPISPTFDGFDFVRCLRGKSLGRDQEIVLHNSTEEDNEQKTELSTF